MRVYRACALAAALLLAACSSDGDGTPSEGGSGRLDKGVARADRGNSPLPDVGNCAQPLQWYPDKDGDGYGDSNAQPVTACAAPSGMVNNPGDCADEDANAHPGQTQFFDQPIKGTVALPFDYNCDSVEEPQSQMGALVCNGRGYTICETAFPRSWLGTKPPACGTKSQVVVSCTATGGALNHKCNPNTDGEQTQVCR